MMISQEAYTVAQASHIIPIQDLLIRYCYAHDFGRVSDVAALFHRDAVVYSMYENDKSYHGRDAIRDWYGPSVDDIKRCSRYSYRTISNPIIDLKGDRAHSVCLLEAYGISLNDAKNHLFFGRYVDDFVKEDGRWCFKRRKISLQFSFPGGPSDQTRNFDE